MDNFNKSDVLGVDNYKFFLKHINEFVLDQENFSSSEDIKELIRLENEFKTVLLSYKKKGPLVYDKFISFILEQEGNILAARIFFRERENTFSKYIPQIIRTRNSKDLQRFKINYKFMHWALTIVEADGVFPIINLVNTETREWAEVRDEKGELDRLQPGDYIQILQKRNDMTEVSSKGRQGWVRNLKTKKYNIAGEVKLAMIFDKISAIRKRLVEQFLPLIVNRSRLFQVRTRKYNNGPVEFIQTSSEGFLAAIDKYVPDRKDNFKGTAVGRMQAEMMAVYSEGFVKLTVKEKRVLYRANIAKYRLGYEDFNKIYAFVVESFPKTTREELKNIIASSEDVAPIDNGIDEMLDSSYNQYLDNAEDAMIEADSVDKLKKGMEFLKIIERKIMRLKGGF